MTKVNYIPMWENEDVLVYAKSQMVDKEIDYSKIVFKNYQIEEDSESDDMYYEIYISEFYVERNTTLEEFNNLVIDNEKLYKSYKTQKGLVNALIKSQHEVGDFEYNVMNIL